MISGLSNSSESSSWAAVVTVVPLGQAVVAAGAAAARGVCAGAGALPRFGAVVGVVSGPFPVMAAPAGAAKDSGAPSAAAVTVNSASTTHRSDRSAPFLANIVA